MKNLKKKIIQNLNDSLDQKKLALLEKAICFAEQSHLNQERQSGEPFFNHPLRVALTISEMKLGINAVIAGILHDVVEDCQVPLSKIRTEFNEEIAFLVQGLTKVNKINCKRKGFISYVG